MLHNLPQDIEQQHANYSFNLELRGICHGCGTVFSCYNQVQTYLYSLDSINLPQERRLCLMDRAYFLQGQKSGFAKALW